MPTPTMPTGQDNDDSVRRPSANGPPPQPQNHPWALRIATVAGIPIRLHFTFLLFLVYIAFSGHEETRVLNLLLLVALFLCVALHELGHSIVAMKFGIPVADITLYPIGGIARIEKRPTAWQELWIAIAGPMVNVVIAVILFIVVAASGGPISPEVVSKGGGGWRGFTEVIISANVMLVLFNLIPAFPMDGGRVLRAILGLNMPIERATSIAANIGQFIAIAAAVFAIFMHPPNWWLLFIALFVYIGAGQEAFAYRQAALTEGVKVHQAMITDVRTLTVGNTLKEAADVLLNTSQHDFPVVHGDEVQGLLTRNDLLRALSQEGPGAYVAGAMNREFASAGPNDDLGEVLPRLQADPGALVVLETGAKRLLGIVTGENVQEFFAVRQIVAAQDDSDKSRRFED